MRELPLQPEAASTARRSSIRRTLIIAFFGLALGPVGLIALLLPWQVYQDAMARTLTQHEVIGQTLAAKAESYFSNLTTVLAMTGEQLLLLDRDPVKDRLRLYALLARDKAFLSAMLLDDRGNEVASVDHIQVVKHEKGSSLLGQTIFDYPTARGEPYFGPIEFDEATGEPTLRMSIPLAVPGTETVRDVLAVEVRLAPIWRLVARMSKQTGTTLTIIDQEGRVVAHPNPSVVLAKTVSETAEGGGLDRDLEGDLSVYATTPFQLGQQKLTIRVDHKAADAMAGPIRTMSLIGLVIAGSVTLALFLVRLARRRITRPLRLLASTADAFAGGDMEQRAPIPPDDETARLAIAFNQMAARTGRLITDLRTLNEDLEARIMERTRALQVQLAERTRTENALRESEGRIRTVMENVLDAIVVTDEEGIIQSFNPAAEAMFGIAAADVIGTSVNNIMPRRNADEHDGHIGRYLSGKGAGVIGSSREVRGRRADGTEFPVELALSEVERKSGRMFIGIMRDISLRKEAEQRLEEAKTAAIRANRAKSEFLSNMSHELRTPLNAILGFSQLLKYSRDEKLSPTQEERIDLVLSSGQHLLKLISDLLDLARVEAGHLTLEPTAVCPRQLIEDAIALVAPQAEAAGIAIHNVTADQDNLPVVWVDRTRGCQVLVNLLANAVKYNRANGSVTLNAVPTEGGLTFSVEDTGTGIAAEDLEHLFEPFERLGAEATAIEGSGIGLAITRQLVELMGGSVTVTSTVGQGSRFSVTLPLAPEDSPPSPAS